MPEEKKENKAVAKDSFTFSDKIKNSKPAGSKSFANRISSKIGSDGKPKKTLFERTKRDAPFFIAAIVALLLLPFLYKYSGSVDEDPAMVTPGYEDAIMNPDRSGFDSLAGDPEGQISQLSGRDSMDLIVGFGPKKEDSENLSINNSFQRSGFEDDEYDSSRNSSREYNEKNVYKYKKQAAPATKAAFQKTNINPLRGAGLNSRGGGKLGVGMWGGGLKQAANKVKAEGPRTSPKPVSLQPLQAAGKPSRSYFGQGAAAEARRSKDAMSKANAAQALRDAQMKPIEPGKIGGIGGGDFGGPGGGNGNLDRKFAFNGKEPWWWDMMKQRSQMEWEKKFNYKWGWIDFATGLAQKLADGLLSCLITGTDDWSMGKMFGAAAGAGNGAECCGMDEEKFKGAAPGVEFAPKACKGWVTAHPELKCATKWVDAKKNSVTLGPISQRLDCLSNGLFSARNKRKAAEGIVEEAKDCLSFYQDGNYTATVAGDYTVYSYVVGVTEDDWNEYSTKTSDDDRQNYLTVKYFQKGGHLSVDPNKENQVINLRGFVPLFVESAAVKNKKIDTKKEGKADKLSNTVSFKGYWGTGGKAKGTCGHFEKVPYDQAVQKCNTMSGLCKRECHSQINEEIRGKDKVKVLHTISENGGTSYDALLEMLREGGIMTDASGSGTLAAKGGKAGKDWSTGARCAYPLAFVSCHHGAQIKGASSGEMDQIGRPAAFLTFPNVGKDLYDKIVKRFTVTYKVADRFAGAAPKGYFAQQVKTTEGYAGSTATGSRYSVNDDKKYNVAAEGKGLAAINMAMGLQQDAEGKVSADEDKSAVVTWEVRQCWDEDVPWRYGRAIEDGACGRVMSSESDGVDGKELPGIIVSTATCVYGDEITVSAKRETPECESDQDSQKCCEEKHPEGDYKWESNQCVQKCPNGKNTSEECCSQLGAPGDVWHDNQCSPLPPDPECPQGQETNEACCTKVPGYHWDANHTPNKCVKDDPQPAGSSRLAPRIAWVPQTITNRQPVQSGGSSSASSFGSPKAVDTVANNTQRCGGDVGESVMDSTAAQNFVRAVVTAYNNANPSQPISYTRGLPKVGEFVDALNIAASVGVQQVDKSAVCELGRNMIDVSQDPHVNTPSFHNELGAFYAYIHEDAVLYPAKFYGSADDCDKRFMAYTTGACHATSNLPHKYHYNNYTFAGNGGSVGIRAYNTSVPNEVKAYPLKKLVEGISFTGLNTCKSLRGRKSCGTQVSQYKQTFGFLVDGTRDGSGSGNACSSLTGTMNVSDVLTYIKSACKLGLNIKPNGAGDNNVGGSGNSVEGGNQGGDAHIRSGSNS